MNLFVYGDESGVFDQIHNDVFAFGGLIFLSKEERNLESRRYSNAEHQIGHLYTREGVQSELKASILSNKHRGNLFRSTNKCIRYAFVVDLKNVYSRIFSSKKTTQRYMDYVFKVGLKKACQRLVDQGKIDPGRVENIHVFFDEHTTATNGRYELRESIEAEFKYGTINNAYGIYHEPVFPQMKGSVQLSFSDSKTNCLIRASDIIANRARYQAFMGQFDKLESRMILVRFP